MDSSNKRKSEQLGMPYGTATQRLRKALLFKYVKLAGDDKCFKCGNQITKLSDFSIEHKLPWLHMASALFWDLNNIAFSHIWCNRPDRPSGSGAHNRIKAPEGMAWCNRHRQFLPKENFSKNKWHWTGLHTLCKQCQHYNRSPI